MGFKTFVSAEGARDVWEPGDDIFWGPEGKWLAASATVAIVSSTILSAAVQMA